MILGGTNSEELARCMLNSSTVLRILITSGGSKTVELWSTFDKTWQSVTSDDARLLMRVFGARPVEFFDRFKPFE